MSMKMLPAPEPLQDHAASTDTRPWVIAGLVTIFLVFGVFGTWSAIAQLTSAAIAPGVVAVDSNWRTVQHLEGGIVAEIMVHEGDEVEEGQILLRLDPTRSDAQYNIIDSQLVLARSTLARLIAERDGSRFVGFDDDLIDRMNEDNVAAAVAGQELLFRARRDTMDGQVSILEQRVDQLEQQIVGLNVQAQARLRQIEIIEEELVGLRELFEEGYVSRQRILALERDLERLRGERGEDIAAVAQTNSSIGETRLQILQLETGMREEVLSELRQVQSQVFELEERWVAAADQVARIEIIAPTQGTVVGLNAHTIGGVIRAGDPILSIVPEDDVLIIDARVKPEDIERVYRGQPAQVRLSGLSQRSTPILKAEVLTVSPDRLTDQATGEPYFAARVMIPEDQIALLEGVELVPGMPAEVLIETGEQSALYYMIDPLLSSFRKAFRD
jgi:HlyD family type I secretion membrane fusion protein